MGAGPVTEQVKKLKGKALALGGFACCFLVEPWSTTGVYDVKSPIILLASHDCGGSCWCLKLLFHSLNNRAIVESEPRLSTLCTVAHRRRLLSRGSLAGSSPTGSCRALNAPVLLWTHHGMIKSFQGQRSYSRKRITLYERVIDVSCLYSCLL